MNPVSEKTEKKFRWGILGPGRIARKFASSLPFSRSGVLTAVASTSRERAEEFSKEFGAESAFSSYEALAESGLVDAIYIATPHAFHRRDAETGLQNGIPVLCEKPLSTCPADSLFLIELARQRNTFLMEGLWTVFLPSFRQALQWIEEGRIGRVCHAEANFGHQVPNDLSGRHFNPDLGGGVMKDIGIYPLALFLRLFGHSLKLQSSGIRIANGLDAQVVFEGISANAESSFQGMVSFLAATGAGASITGTLGRIVFEPQWFRPVRVRLEIPGSEALIFDGRANGFGFQFEADEVARCVNSGLIESPLWTHADSMEAARLISLAEKF